MEHVALVVSPHPDDAEIGMGGTIASLVRQGARVVIVDLTNGEPTPFGSPEIRAKETQRATEILRGGAEQPHKGSLERRLLTIKNREVFDTVDNRKLLATIIREIRPSLLFVPYWEDAHPDHVQANALAEAARFYSKFTKSDMPFEPWHPRKMLSYFSTHLRVRMAPSFIFDISPYLDTKIHSIQAYESQFVVHTGNAARIDAIRHEARYWGDQIGVAAGEPFICRENIRVGDAAALFSL